MAGADKARGQRRPAELLTGCAGLTVFVAVWFSSPDVPEGASASAARRFYEDNLDAIAWSVVAESVAFGAMVVLAVGLYSLMRDAEKSSGRLLSSLAAFSGLLVAVWFWVQASLDAIPWVLADDHQKLTKTSDQAVLSLDPIGRLGETFGDLSTVPRGLMVLAVSLLAVRTRFLPRWLAYIGLATAFASLIAVLAVGPLEVLSAAWFLGLIGFILWLLLLAALMVLRGLRSPRPGRVAHAE
jgi:hypothetical protein